MIQERDLGTAASTRRSAQGYDRSLESDEQEGRVFERVAHRLHERRPDVSVDYAMVEGARQVHHVPDHDLVVPDHGALLDLVDAEDPDLGPVDDRRREDASVLAEGRDREGGPEHVLEGQLLFPGRIREAFDFLREAPQVPLVRLVDDGDGQPLVRGGRDPDVVVSLDDDFAVLVVDGAVERRELLEAPRTDLMKNGRNVSLIPFRSEVSLR